MTLPSSGPLSFSDIRDEFGGSNPVVFSDYYRGGGLVPDISANIGVPTSGTIKLSDFYGATNFVVSLTDHTLADNQIDPNDAGCQLVVESDGELRKTEGGTSTSLAPEWGDPQIAGVGSDYEVRLTKTSGADPSSGPALGVNHSLSSTRLWQWGQSSIGSKSFQGTLEIYEAGGGSPIATCTITVNLNVDSGI